VSHEPQPTKRERREAAKAERIAAEQQAAAAEARKRRLGIFGGLLVGAVLIVIGAIALSSNKDTSSPTASAAAINKLYADIPQQGLTLGDPKAKATMILFEDPQCPACQAFDTTELPDVVKNLVRTGKAKLELHFKPFLGDDSVTASQALYAAAEQDKMFEAAGVLYAEQGPENSGWVTDAKLRQILGAVPGLDVDKAIKAAAGSTPARHIAEAQALADRFQPDRTRQGTPEVYIGTSVTDAQKTDPTAAAINKAVNEIAN